MNKKTLFLTLLTVLILPSLASATDAAVTITSLTDAAVNTALFIAGGVIVILWVVTGLLFLSALGAPDKLTLAKKALIASVIGTLLVIIAVSATSMVRDAFNIPAS